MIIQVEYTIRKDGIKLIKTYSNNNKYIKKVGTDEIYDAAIDPENELENRVYLETEENIPAKEDIFIEEV